MNCNNRKKRLERLQVPIIQGGMGVGISLGGLAGAVAETGAMGVISTANIGFREPDFWENPEAANHRAIVSEIRKARELSKGRGLIAVNAMVATSNFMDMARAAGKAGIDAIISGAGLPLNLPEADPEGEVLLAPIVSSGRAAKLICNRWRKTYNRLPDFIVVEGHEAGGHLGFDLQELLEEKAKSLKDILTEVREAVESWNIPIFAGGSIFDRKELLDIQEAGAAGAQIATRFIATPECDASQGYKDVILKASAEDVSIVQSPVGMPGRAIQSPLIQRVKETGREAPERCIGCIKTCNPATTPYCISRALIAAFHGDWEHGLFFTGNQVGRIHEMKSVREIIAELMGQEATT